MSTRGIYVPERERAYSQDYHARHREVVRAKKRARYAANREKELARFAERRKTQAPVEKARNALRWAVWTGKIIKPENCEICGEKDTLHGHHADYGRPLDVQWLCRVCHGRVHRK